MTHRILVTGSRTWTDTRSVQTRLESCVCLFGPRLVVVHGGCPTGGDAIADMVAGFMKLTVERHPADWGRHGKRAGFVRNAEMVALGAAICLAFIDQASKGATMTADLAEKQGILTLRYRPSSPEDL